MDTRNTINDILVNLFNEIMDLEEREIIKGEFKNISVNDMHILDAIGPGEGKNMSAIAKLRGVTIGSLSTSMNSLVKKGYVTRERGKEDRRVVYISLSEKGRHAYEHHEQFHHNMIDAILQDLTPNETESLVKALAKLNIWFRKVKA